MNTPNRPQFGEMVEPDAANYCYRHPGQASFTLCQRCGNTICHECQTQGSVGVLCPDCVHELTPPSTARIARQTRAQARKLSDADTPIVTYSIIALCVVVWLAQMSFSGVTAALAYVPAASTPFHFEPWRLVTSIFTHSTGGIQHIAFNMLSLYLFGRQLELMIGRRNFFWLFLLSGLGGSTVVMLWSLIDHQSVITATVGASGALFGVLAATVVVLKRININATSLIVMLVINFAIGFMPGLSISWQAHLGGLLTGGLLMWLLIVAQQRAADTKAKARAATTVFISVTAILVAISVWYYFFSQTVFAA